MAKLPRVTGQSMVRFLEREGYQLLRVRGSHYYLAKGGSCEHLFQCREIAS